MKNAQELLALYNERFTINQFDLSPNSLYDPVKHILAIPGKKIRPLLLLIANQLYSEDVEKALEPAFAMEIFHNFTLVHDDIMDDASLRRGQPTVHEKYGINSGILAGDVMLSYAYKFLCNVDDAILRKTLTYFNQTAIEIYEGQQLDVDFEKRMDVTVEEYLLMIKYKTSVLLACSLQIGALIGGASDADQKLLYDFGINLGLSFQIKDDWLDTFGQGEKVGKKIGGDILQNKKTYLLISALTAEKNAASNEIAAILAMPKDDAKINAMLSVFEKYKVKENTLIYAEELFKKAIANLEQLSIPDAQKAPLLQLAKMVNNRDF